MQKWEYLVRSMHRTNEENQALLNELGQSGWQLVLVIGLTFYFKRPMD